MAQAFVEEWRDRWWFLLVPLAVVIVALTSLVAGHRSDPEADVGSPIQVQSAPWRVGEDAELTIRTRPPSPGRAISLTIMSPGPGQPQIEGLPPEFFGLSGVQIPWLAEEDREREMLLAATSGARYIGLDFDWQRIEPQPGRFAWEHTDEAVALAKRYGLRLVPMLLYTPRWASTASFAPLDYHHAPPVDYADFRDFVYAVVARYKPYGTSKLTAEGYGITDWAIWNEPNIRSHPEAPAASRFWAGSMEEYLLLLRAGYEGAHAADPGCNVLNGALADVFWAEGELDLITALEQLYDPNGDGQAGDGARPFFDTLNIHTYQTGMPDAVWYEERLEEIVALMARFGDGQKTIWITETGYGSVEHPVAGQPYIDEQTQAEAVRLIYRTCSAFRQVERVFWWSLRDYYSDASATNRAMEGHHGLVRVGFTPKPAYLAYAQLTGRVGQVLTVDIATDAQGVAQLSVPASFVAEPGIYMVFISLDGVRPAVVAAFEASGGEGR
jgi:GH35 family endo-1,4-beta-xylanase